MPLLLLEHEKLVVLFNLILSLQAFDDDGTYTKFIKEGVRILEDQNFIAAKRLDNLTSLEQFKRMKKIHPKYKE